MTMTNIDNIKAENERLRRTIDALHGAACEAEQHRDQARDAFDALETEYLRRRCEIAAANENIRGWQQRALKAEAHLRGDCRGPSDPHAVASNEFGVGEIEGENNHGA